MSAAAFSITRARRANPLVNQMLVQDSEIPFRHGKRRILREIEIHDRITLDAPEMPMLANVRVEPHLAVPEENFFRRAFFAEQLQRLINRATG